MISLPVMERVLSKQSVVTYSIDHLVTQNYDSVLSPAVRGVYYKGSVQLPTIRSAAPREISDGVDIHTL